MAVRTLNKNNQVPNWISNNQLNRHFTKLKHPLSIKLPESTQSTHKAIISSNPAFKKYIMIIRNMSIYSIPEALANLVWINRLYSNS